MPSTFLRTIAVAIAVAAPVAAFSQDEKTTSRKPERGDTVVAVGCMRGSSLESQETRLAEGIGTIDAAITYRLTGNKEALKQLKADHSRHLEEITGVLKSQVPDPNAARGKQIGKTGIFVGMGPANASQAQALPVLEVISFKHVGTECGR